MTEIIQLTRAQVVETMMRVIDDLQAQYPNEDDALAIADALGTIFDRTLLKDNVIPRIQGHKEIDWLVKKGIAFAVKSSVAQFTERHILRIQILKREQRQAFRRWQGRNHGKDLQL